MSSEQESPAPVPADQPDPVIVGPGMTTMGDGAYTSASNATPSLFSDKKHQLLNDAPSYISDISAIDDSPTSPSSSSAAHPTQPTKEPKSGTDILRRLSLIGDASPTQLEADPREQHPGLHLTRRIISAAFCIPYKLYYRSGSDWVGIPSPFRLAFQLVCVVTNWLPVKRSSNLVGALPLCSIP